MSCRSSVAPGISVEQRGYNPDGVFRLHADYPEDAPAEFFDDDKTTFCRVVARFGFDPKAGRALPFLPILVLGGVPPASVPHDASERFS